MTSITRLFASALTAAAISCVSLGSAVAAPVFSITGPPSVSVGSTFGLSVVATDVTDLYAYQLDVTFDPTLFQATGVSQGGFLPSGGTTFFDGGTIDNVLGTISFVFDTLLGPGPGVSGGGELVALSFTSIGSGIGTFGLANVIALDSALNDIPVGTQGLTVAAVPEPASWMLAGFALFAAFSTRRRNTDDVKAVSAA